VPRYFLHVTNGQKTYQDTVGLDLCDAAAAQAFARVIANDLRGEAMYASYYVDVQDKEGNRVAKILIAPRR
jgi:hypothetical protein